MRGHHVVLRGALATEFKHHLAALPTPATAEDFLQRLHRSRDPNLILEWRGDTLTIRRVNDGSTDRWPAPDRRFG